jgi:predicted helicase
MPIEKRANYSFQGAAYIAPIYIYGENLDGESPGVISKVPNFTRSFHKKYFSILTWKPSSEDILSYIYAVLHSNIYRKKYLEFLKTDFPAIPMTRNKAIFNKYSKLGSKLIDLHTLKNISEDKSITVSLGGAKGNLIIDKLVFANNKINLSVSPADKTSKGGLVVFEKVTSSIFDFEIGARKPIDLWIKNRIKDRVSINLTDLQHIKNMIIVIKETIKIMEKIELLGEEYLIDIS